MNTRGRASRMPRDGQGRFEAYEDLPFTPNERIRKKHPFWGQHRSVEEIRVQLLEQFPEMFEHDPRGLQSDAESIWRSQPVKARGRGNMGTGGALLLGGAVAAAVTTAVLLSRDDDEPQRRVEVIPGPTVARRDGGGGTLVRPPGMSDAAWQAIREGQGYFSGW